MNEQSREHPIPALIPTSEEMGARIEQLKAAGRMPSLEELLQAMATIHEENTRSTFRAGVRIARKVDAVEPIHSAEQNSPGPRGGAWKADLTVVREGNIITFAAHTEAGTRFLHEDLHTEPWQWIGDVLCVNQRLAEGVMVGARKESLTVQFVEQPWGCVSKTSRRRK
jgi:hypothetical protein